MSLKFRLLIINPAVAHDISLLKVPLSANGPIIHPAIDHGEHRKLRQVLGWANG
jgi:hypothetical protein